MANATKPTANDPERTGDVNRAGEAVGPVDEGIVLEGADEPVHLSSDFPGGGAGPDSGHGDPSDAVRTEGAAGSTGRNATDAGKSDSEGVPGGGMAGSAGG